MRIKSSSSFSSSSSCDNEILELMQLCQEEEFEKIRIKFDCRANENKEIIKEIFQRSNKMIVTGLDFNFECNLPLPHQNNGSEAKKEREKPWKMNATPKKSLVKILIEQWRYKGKELEVADDIFNTNVDYKMSNFEDLKRLTHELFKLGVKYFEYLQDNIKTRKVLLILLKNLSTLKKALNEVFLLTRDQRYPEKEQRATKLIQDIVEKFNELKITLPETNLKLNLSCSQKQNYVTIDSESSLNESGTTKSSSSISRISEEENNFETLSEIKHKIEVTAKQNEDIAAKIASQKHTKVTTAHEYHLNFQLPTKANAESTNAISTQVFTEEVRAIVENWKWRNIHLQRTKLLPTSHHHLHHRNEVLDYSIVKNFNNLLRLNKEMLKTAKESSMLSIDNIETREEMNIVLSNLLKINQNLKDLEKAIQNQADTISNNSQKIHQGLQSISRGFNQVITQIPSAQLVLSGQCFLGNPNSGGSSAAENKATFISFPLKNEETTAKHTSTVKALHTFRNHKNQNLLASVSSDKTINIWQNKNCIILRRSTQSNIDAIKSFQMHNSRLFLALAGCYSNDIDIWDFQQNKLDYSLIGHTASIKCLEVLTSLFSYDIYLISGSEDKSIKIWSLNKKALITTLTGHTDVIYSMTLYDINDEIQNLASTSRDQTIKIWEIRTPTSTTAFLKSSLKTTVSSHTHYMHIITCYAKHDKIYLATGSHDGVVFIWDAINNKKRATLHNGHSNQQVRTLLTFFTDQSKLALASTGGSDGFIRIWDLEHYSLLHTLDCYKKVPITSLSTFYLKDLKKWYLVSGNDTGEIMWWI